MVRVIAVSNPRLAQAFVDYMTTQGIELSVHNTGEAAEIWLADDSHLDQVQHELQQFLVDPLNRRYQAASWEAGNTGADLHSQATPICTPCAARPGRGRRYRPPASPTWRLLIDSLW